MARNKTFDQPNRGATNPWALNRLALTLLIVLIVFVGYMAVWFVLKNPGGEHPPIEGTPVPKKHTSIMMPQMVSTPSWVMLELVIT